MTVLIVIENYRTADLPIDCQCSLRDETQLVPGIRAVPRIADVETAS